MRCIRPVALRFRRALAHLEQLQKQQQRTERPQRGASLLSGQQGAVIAKGVLPSRHAWWSRAANDERASLG